jgi:Dual specificity phosphatase, catalytic domain
LQAAAAISSAFASNALARRVGAGKLGAAIICTLLIVAGVVTWTNVVRWWFFPNNFAVVEPERIYRSAQLSRFLIRRTLIDNRIGLVIDLSKDETADTAAERKTTAELGIPRLNFVLCGNGTGRPECYSEAIAAIINANAQGKAVLVHCQSGAQRTGGVIATYRMLVQGKSEADAFAEAERYWLDPKRNPDLIPFVDEHLPEWKAELSAEHLLLGS